MEKFSEGFQALHICMTKCLQARIYTSCHIMSFLCYDVPCSNILSKPPLMRWKGLNFTALLISAVFAAAFTTPTNEQGKARNSCISPQGGGGGGGGGPGGAGGKGAGGTGGGGGAFGFESQKATFWALLPPCRTGGAGR